MNYVMGVPGTDDVMLGYQSTSYHDAAYLRRVLGLRPAPEFADWLDAQGITIEGELAPVHPAPAALSARLLEVAP